MLSDRTRNTIVGLTMIVALAAFMVGVFILKGLPSFSAAAPYKVTLTTTDANGVAPGNQVKFNGVDIGSVASVQLSPDFRHVDIDLSIQGWVSLPANAEAHAGKAGLVSVGSPEVSFFMPPGPTGHPVAKDGSAKFAAVPMDSSLIPQTTIDLFQDRLTSVSNALEKFLLQKPLSDFEKEDPNTRVANISILVQRLDRVARGVDVLIGDPKTQEQFREIVQNIRDATVDLRGLTKRLDDTLTRANTGIDKFGETADKVSAAATQAGATLDTTRVEILKTAQRVADLLASVQKSTDAIAAGKGTMGALVNDSRLYDGMLDLTRSLKNASDELKVLMEKWSDEGLGLHLK